MKTTQQLIEEAKSEIKEITCEELQQLKTEGIEHVILDVREKEEWDVGHIEGAVHVPRGLLEFKITELVPDQDTLIITQCASGGRSALCAQTLEVLGYKNVKSLAGGYNEYCSVVKE